MRSYHKLLIPVIGLFMLCHCGGDAGKNASIAKSEVKKEFSIGILDANFLRKRSNADPQFLLTALNNQGFQSRIVTETDFDKPELVLSKDLDLIVLPNGSYFPKDARESFINYLKNGGSFISLGGYAFDELVEKKNEHWQPVRVDDPAQTLSGRRGKAGDILELLPEQISIFDPTYTFKRVTKIAKDPQSPLNTADQSEEINIFGHPATAMSGNNNPVFTKSHARWHSLVSAYDRFGRPRGSVFSLMLHHDGYYNGSAWAFSGVNNINLFSASHPIMVNSLIDAVYAMRDRTFLVSVETDRSSLEFVEIAATAANRSRWSQTAKLTFFAGEKEIGSEEIALAEGETKTFRQKLDPIQLQEGYTPIAVELQVEDVFHDRLETGAIRSSVLSGSKPTLTFSNNYFRVKGRPLFLFGTNQTGTVWFSPDENPATWKRDFQRMKDNGLRLLRVIHLSPFAAQGFEGKGQHASIDLGKQPPPKLVQKADELAALCAQNGIFLMLGLHDWLPVELAPEELDAQRQWGRFWSDHFKNDPHVLFDIQNEPSLMPKPSPNNNKLWNDYLREKYADDAKIKEAWGTYAPAESLGGIPCEPGPDEWPNPRAYEYNRFRAWLVERWIDANVKGIKEGNPNALTTVGFLQNGLQADKLIPSHRLDFMNTHYHGPMKDFPTVMKMTDRRFKGQGLTLGEFSAWDAHEARVQGQFNDETDSAIAQYLCEGLETFGLGGSMALNWDLKDLNECIFPWGLTWPQDGVAKDWFYAYRNLSLFLSSFRPQYEDPGVYLLIPDSHRLGAQAAKIQQGIDNALRMMFAAHCNFNVINEESISQLPPTARTLIWPIPYCPSDEVFQRVLSFAANGGNLLYTGEADFDPLRRAKSQERSKTFLLSDHAPRQPFTVESPTSVPEAIVSEYQKGKIHYLPAPLELAESPFFRPNPYAAFLQKVNEATIAIEPDDPAIHVFTIPEDNGNAIYTFFRNEEAANTRNYRIRKGDNLLNMYLAGYESGLIETNSIGDVLAIGGKGTYRRERDIIILMTSFAMVKSLDQMDISSSGMILLLPTAPARIRLWNTVMTSPKLIVGEIVNGQWITYEEEDLTVESGRMQFKIDADRASCILLITSDALKSLAQQNVMSLVN
ncbi:MAG: cellulase family glycosylhydrolase [Candidatus Omnitrophota bacterium]